MHTPGGEPTDDRDLRRRLRDLAALTASVWGGGDRGRMADGLAGAVLKVFTPDLVYVRFEGGRGRGPVEVTRRAAGADGVLAPVLADGPVEDAVLPLPASPDGGAAVTAVGRRGEYGVLVTASGRPGFPTEEERLLLRVVANQAAVVLERQRTEDSLRESERLFARFMQHLPGLAWIKDAHGRYTFVNEAAAQAFGVPAERLQGRTDEDLFPPETAVEFQANDRQALHGAGVRVIETLKHPDGAVHFSLVSKFPIPGADGEPAQVGGMAVDITDLKRVEESLKRSEAQFRQLADALPQIVWTAQPDGLVDYYNERWYEFTGFPRGDVGDPSWRPILHPDDVQHCVDTYYDSVRSGRPYEIEYRFKDRRTGGYRWFLGRAYAVRDEAGRVVRWFGTCTDIDDRKRAEDALADASIRKDEFLAMLAHELRNPLAPIRNALHILKQPQVNAAVRSQMRDMAERQVAHMARLLEDLLDVSRISRGEIVLRNESVDLKPLLRRALESVRPLAEEFGHRLTESLPPQALRVRGDPVRLEQVVVNLLNNAVKYTDAGGLVRQSAGREGEAIVLRVQDNGIGIAPDMLPSIFDAFVRAERRLDRTRGGVGIGLTLVKRLVELHGGSIEARSDGLGRGSEFIVRLPALAGDAAPRHRVLVVDDIPDSADSLAMLLRLSGQDVRTAYDGLTALAVEEEFRPTLVFLDLGMPGMDGYEVAGELRRRRGPEMRLAALTGWGQAEDSHRSREAGFDHHFVKPIELRAIQALLTELK